MSTELQLIPLRNNLLVDYKYTEAKNQIISRLGELHLCDGKYKNDNQLLNLICELVEHLIVKKDKIVKKDLVVDIYLALFGLTDDEKKTLENNINFLWSNAMIKKVSMYKLFKTGVKEWFRKKG
jgi:hypothetical protein